MWVDGKPSEEFGQLKLADGQEIVIAYGSARQIEASRDECSRAPSEQLALMRPTKIASAGLAAAIGLYGIVARPRLLRYGATDAEVDGPYPGAGIIAAGRRGATMATTFNTSPSRLWPWLVQMGCDRAGWYSWDRLDSGSSFFIPGPLALLRLVEDSDPVAQDVSPRGRAAVDLYWLPLGAGGHSVRLNGRAYEAIAARLDGRRPQALYHSALQVEVPEGTFVIEQAPVHGWGGEPRGVVAEGPVGARWAGRFRIFRYEIRLWRGGRIPDVAEAVESPRQVTNDERHARRVLELIPQVPTPVWGRDELHAGEMWNSNSVIAWVIARSGIDPDSIRPPQGGRAPGLAGGSSGRAQGNRVPRVSTDPVRD